MLEVRYPIANFYLLVLRVLSNITPGGIHKSSWVTQTLLKESFELNSRQKCYFLALIYAFIPIKADLITKEQSYIQGMVDVSDAGNIEIIFAVFGFFLLAYRFGMNNLSLKEKIHIKHCHRPKVFLDVFGRSYSEGWISYIAWCEASYFKEFLRAFGLLCLNKSMSGRFGKNKILVPLLWILELSN